MTKLRNRIVLVLLALCLVVTAGLFVACGGDDKKPSGTNTVTYTVTVKADNEAVKGVKVTVKKGTVAFAPKTTGDDGKVEFSLAKADDYEVELDNLPANYEAPEGKLTFPADRNLTVNLAEKFAYKVKLVKEGGEPFTATDVDVQICTADGTICLEGVRINENGVARIEAAKGNYHIKVNGLPEDYAYECDSHGYSVHKTDEGTYIYEGTDNTYNTLTETVTEQTITVYSVNVIDFSKLTPLTDQELTDRYNDSNRTVTGGAAYRVALDIAAGETAYYVFTPEYSGKYTLYPIGYDSASMGYNINEWFLLGNVNTSGSGVFNANGQVIEVAKGENWYINVTNKSASTKLEGEFVLATPLATKDTVTGAETVKAVINKEGSNAVIALAPTSGAAYKLTVQGEAAIAKEFYAESAENHEFVDTDPVSDYTTNPSCEARFAEDQNGRITELYFAISVKANSYPATVEVKVEKTATLTTTVENVQPTVTLTQFGAQTGKELVPIEMDGTSSDKIIYNETDKFYHYGTADGPLVVVMLTEALPADRFAAQAPLLYLELATNMQRAPYLFDLTTDKNSLTEGNTYKDYREMLRGFKDYKVTPTTGIGGNTYTIPADITVQSYYAKYVNGDGVYPLTNDLKDYLQYVVADGMVADDYVQWQLPMDAAYEDFWLFACYYYDTYIEPDVIVGEYNHVTVKAVDGDEYLSEENGGLNGDEYSLIVNKRGTYVIKNYDGDVVEKGTWTKEGEVYAFTKEGGEVVYSDVQFDAEDGIISLSDSNESNIWTFRNENSEVVDVIVGDYEFVRRVDAFGEETTTKDAYTLTVSNDGTFMVYELVDDEKMEVYNNFGEWEYKRGVYTFTVPYGVWDDDAGDYADLVFVVDYNIGTGELKLTGSDTSEWEFKKDGEAFVGLYELVSFAETAYSYETYENVTTAYEIGDTYEDTYTYSEFEVTNDFFVLNVIGKTVHFSGYEIGIYNFVGTWTKTVGGKYTITGKNANDSIEFVVRFNKAANTWSFTVGDDPYMGIATVVLKKKADQPVDPIVGEYTNLVKMADNEGEYTVAAGDILSDDYKLRVMPGGRFDIVEYGYPYYNLATEPGTIGKWSKTDSGYAFTYYDYDAANSWNYGEVAYTVTLSNDLSEISLVRKYTMEEDGEQVEVTEAGWWFTKSAEDVGEADAVVGEYNFVLLDDGWGDPIKVGDLDVYDGVLINEAYYNLLVFRNGRFVIDSVSVAEDAIVGTWNKADEVYTFVSGSGRSRTEYTVDFDAATGRIMLTANSYYGSNWIFQKGGNAELTTVVAIDDALLQAYDNNTYALYVGNKKIVSGMMGYGEVSVTDKDSTVTTAEAEYDMGVYTWTINDNKYVYNMLGEFVGGLLSTNGGAKLELYDNNGIKFYYHVEAEEGETEPTDTLACVALALDSQSATMVLDFIWLEDNVLNVEVMQSMKNGEDGTHYVEIKVQVYYFDGEPATYIFQMPMGGGAEQE